MWKGALFPLCSFQFTNSRSLLKMSLTLQQMFFKYFASKNQLPGFYISVALVENELITTF